MLYDFSKTIINVIKQVIKRGYKPPLGHPCRIEKSSNRKPAFGHISTALVMLGFHFFYEPAC